MLPAVGIYMPEVPNPLPTPGSTVRCPEMSKFPSTDLMKHRGGVLIAGKI